MDANGHVSVQRSDLFVNPYNGYIPHNIMEPHTACSVRSSKLVSIMAEDLYHTRILPSALNNGYPDSRDHTEFLSLIRDRISNVKSIGDLL